MNGMTGLSVAAALAKRELVRFGRQPGRIVAAVGTPLLIWLWLWSGLAEAIRPEHMTRLSWPAFLVPGIMTLIIVFASMLTSISTIEDRQQGWMQAVLVSPAPPWSIAAGKILGGAVVAWAQAIVLIAVLFLLVDVRVAAFALVAAAVAVTSIAVSALGLVFAWRSESTASFHAVMNLVFMPMWLLSSAVFPSDGAATWIRWVMHVNPLSWCTEAIRAALQAEVGATSLLAVAFAVATSVCAVVVVRRC